MSLSRDGRTLGAIRPRYPSEPGQAVVLPDLGQPERTVDLCDDRDLESIAEGPSGRWVAVGSWSGAGTAIWDLRDGPRGAPPARSAPTRAAFSPDGRRLVTGSADADRFWKVGTWAPIGRPIPRDRANLRAAFVFSRDGSVLALASSRREVRLFDPASGRVLATITAPDPRLISWLCFSPDGGRLVVACEGRIIQLWDLRSIRLRLAAMRGSTGTSGPSRPRAVEPS